jgi:hypothetical protein
MSPTVQKPRRIIEAAMIEGVGPLSARELLSMPEDDWGIIRDRITDRASGKADGRVARCMMCEGRVFIQTRVKGGKGPVAELVGIESGVVSGVFNLESSGVSASDWRPRHDEHYHEA